MDFNLMRFDKTITTWDEAIPLGNGAVGCLIWGKSNALRLSLDRCDMWDCTDAPKAGGRFTYENLIRLYKEGKHDEIYEIFDTPYSKPSPTKLPAGKIIIDLGVDENVVSELDLERAEATITAGDVVLKSFLDATSQVGLILINTDSCDFKLENPEYGKIGEPNVEDKDSLKNLHYEDAVITDKMHGNLRTLNFTQKISDSMTYGLFLAVKKEDGKTFAAYTVCKGASAEEILAKAHDTLSPVMASCYNCRFKPHKEWWDRYWSESFLKIGDKLFEQSWYFANYLLASCSRKGFYPMPLQGVWTADDGGLPPWKGDYHHDLNTQLSYYSYLKSNHIPEGECFIDYLLSLEEVAEKFAKDYYNADAGLCMPSVMDIEGNPLGGWPMYSLSPTNTAWLCKAVADHYHYTGNEEYLRDKAYPFIKKYGLFLECILKENGEGKLVLPISSSPELHDNTHEAFITPNSTYDLSLMRYAFEELARLASHLGYTEDADKWNTLLSRMDDFPVDTDGFLMISRNERLCESHRHFSHLMPIHPLRQIRYESEREKFIIDGSITATEKLGIFYYVGYSFCLLAQLYVVQRNADMAYAELERFWNDFCLPNGFHANGDYKKKYGINWDYRPFTLEANFCAVDALQEMFLLDSDGKVTVSPAIPEKWRDYSFKLRSKNGVIITAEVKDASLVKLQLEAYKDTIFELIFGYDKIADVCLKRGETKIITL